MKSVYKKISRLHCSMDAFIKWLYNSIYCFECVRKAKFSLKIQLHTTKYNTYYMLVNVQTSFYLFLATKIHEFATKLIHPSVLVYGAAALGHP